MECSEKTFDEYWALALSFLTKGSLSSYYEVAKSRGLLQDLMQEIALCILEFIQRHSRNYDPEKGKISTYFWWWVFCKVTSFFASELTFGMSKRMDKKKGFGEVSFIYVSHEEYHFSDEDILVEPEPTWNSFASVDPSEEVEDAVVFSQLMDLLEEKFHPRDAYILKSRLQGKTFSELSEQLHISRQRVEQLEKRCIKNLAASVF